MPEYQQNPDGEWTPAEPLGFQPGLDWEVCGPNNVGPRYTATLYRGNAVMSIVTASGQTSLAIRMRLRSLSLRLKGRL